MAQMFGQCFVSDPSILECMYISLELNSCPYTNTMCLHSITVLMRLNFKGIAEGPTTIAKSSLVCDDHYSVCNK